MESASSGMTAGINAARLYKGLETVTYPKCTMTGALSRYISDSTVTKFQPMGANLGILPELSNRPRDKAERARLYAERSLEELEAFFKEFNILE